MSRIEELEAELARLKGQTGADTEQEQANAQFAELHQALGAALPELVAEGDASLKALVYALADDADLYTLLGRAVHRAHASGRRVFGPA